MILEPIRHRRKAESLCAALPCCMVEAPIDGLLNNMRALFTATVKSTEEAIYNSLLQVVTVTSTGRAVKA